MALTPEEIEQIAKAAIAPVRGQRTPSRKEAHSAAETAKLLTPEHKIIRDAKAAVEGDGS